MSKFSFDKLKGRNQELPTLRFSSNSQGLEIVDQFLGFSEKENVSVNETTSSEPGSISSSQSNDPKLISVDYSSTPPTRSSEESDQSITPIGQLDHLESSISSSTDQLKDSYTSFPSLPLDKDTSPLKERLLISFAKLAPDPGGKDEQEGSWLHQVKGKLAKTVDTSLEKYAELKAERSRNSKLEQSGSLDLEDPVPVTRRISHSYSEMTLQLKPEETSVETPRPQSQIFEFDSADWVGEKTEPKPCQLNPERINLDLTKHDQSLPNPGDLLSSSAESRTAETPTKTRKRFGMSFLDRTPVLDRPPGSPVDTPKRSFRSLMRSYVSKPTTELSSSPASSLHHNLQDSLILFEDPFSGADLVTVDQSEAKHEEVAEPVDEDGVDALEADEMVQLDDPAVKQDNESVLSPPPVSVPSIHTVPLTDFVSPVVICILTIVNFTGLFPSWLSGFVTGLMVCGISLVWILLKLYPSVSYSPSRRNTVSTHITVHEPPLPVEAWMNLLPQKFHPYDVDKYEVKNTISVKVTVEHQMLKIEYPDKNIPKRLNTDEVIPADLKFHFHTDHVDLTTARIGLLPDGIAGKRMFSKKYPIEIRPNCVSAPDTLDSDRELDVSKPNQAHAHLNLHAQKADSEFHSLDSPVSTKDDTEKDIDELDDESPTAEIAESDEKVFYLFARADREKEDIYKALMNAHYFLADTFLDVTRKPTDSNRKFRRETVRERKSNFVEFMSKILEQPTPSIQGSETSTDWCIHFFNVYLHRIFYDIHKSLEVKNLLRTRIHNKLLKIKITQWFKQISVTEIDMGSNLPKIQWVSRPTQNERGLWVQLGVEYGGIASATIETCGFNLVEEHAEAGGVHLKALLEEHPEAIPVRPPSPGRKSSRIEAATNSEEEDSAESDSEESGETPQSFVESPAHRTRWWEMVGNSEIVKTGINRLSNSEWWKAKTSKKMTLQLEVVSLKGVIVLNIPPPPSDRIWYGFKNKPELDLRILPYYGDVKLGEDGSLFSTAVNKGIHVLVNRLKDEIHKFILLPNMDDLPVKIMSAFPTSNLQPNLS
ncbi:testis-expressed protein 2 isoform X2 [Eurytemora carolleeae]|uniref:testis-expressed protein 2 isoform X2 n=1 Tax=Eurytemora carolleeae TaxID=1294199 RepID=UPI000C77E175|nr:testis-expressed protein 2 isoform X2 [Eurytemora carolleeae]|eukprot:XP_023346164.1 testis-expressed protein 2-like isoform X2 [Eurytemora affinis]